MTTYLLGAILFLATAPSFLVIGLLVLHVCKCGWQSFWHTLPEEEPMDPPKRIEDVTLVEDELPKALVRIKEVGWRMPCGHHQFEFCAVKGVCLQCVLEGRVAHRDMGRNQ